MSLKSTILAKAVQLTAKGIVTSETGSKIYNTVIDKSQSSKYQKSRIDYEKRFKDQNYLIFRCISQPLTSILLNLPAEPYDNQSYMTIYEKDVLKYTVDRFSNSYRIHDSSQNLIGKIDLHFFAMGDFLEFERKVEKCTVYWSDNQLCTIKKYLSSGNLCFSTSNNFRIKQLKSQDKYSIYRSNKKIASLNNESKHRYISNDRKDKYSLNFSCIDDEEQVVLISAAIDLLLAL